MSGEKSCLIYAFHVKNVYCYMYKHILYNGICLFCPFNCFMEVTMEELIDVLDSKGNKTGIIKKK